MNHSFLALLALGTFASHGPAAAAGVQEALHISEAQFAGLLREAAENEGRTANPEEQNAQEFFPGLLEKNYLRALARSSERTFQGFDLPTLVQDLRRVDFYWMANGFATGSEGTRQGGVHTVSNRRVVINHLTWKRTEAKQRPLLVLHEAIGALGYDDEDYALSFALDWFVKTGGKARGGAEPRAPFKVKTRRSDQEKVYVARNGGSSIVGGGGDVCEIIIKQALTDAFAKEPALLQLALDARIECDGFRQLEYSIDNDEFAPYSIDRAGGRIRIRTRSILELVYPHYPWLPKFIESSFRRFVAGRKR